jgi:SAM-dependent methyltransferase
VTQPGRTFGRVADAYARTRPAYQAEALDRAIAELALSPSATVLDLGAGTGNLTRALRERFAEVIAVEPDAGMRAQFDGEVLDGSAEAIPLDDDSVDAVFSGEAFHWFDTGPAIAEIERVVRPGGGLAVLARMWGEPEQPGLVPPEFKAAMDEVWARFHAPDRTFPDWRTPAGLVGHEEFVETVPISGRDLVDLHLTGSVYATISDDERTAIAERAYPLMDDRYEIRVVTYLSWRRFPA